MMKQYKDKEWLERKYWEEELSKSEIAKLCNVGYTTIHYWMTKFDISRRSISEALKGIVFSEEHIKNLSKSQKGHIPWNKGMKDCYSKEIIKRMVKSHIGQIPWNKDIPRSQMTKDKISEKLIKANKRNRRYGINSPNWQGGITPLQLSIRTNFRYRQWRSDVFTRDDFTCQDCGDNRGGNFEAHHIKSFSSIMQKYEITTLEEALECEELWNINNGKTLCEDCHKKTDNYLIYKGKKNKEMNRV